MRMWKIRAVRSVLLVFVVVVIGLGLSMHVPPATCDQHFFNVLGTDHPGIDICSSSRVQQTVRTRTIIVYSSIRAKHTYSVNDCCVSYTADR